MWMTSLFFSGLALVIALGPVNHSGFPRWLEILLGLLLVGGAQHYLWHRLFHASIMSPDALPLPFLVGILLITAFLMAAMAATLVVWALLLCRIPIPQWVALVVGVLGAVWMVWQGYRLPPVKEHTVILKDLPTAAEGLRVAVVADLHIDHWHGRAWCEKVVARLNATRPDIVIFTGDQLDGPIALRREDLAPLKEVQAPKGKYFVTGNHEYYFDTEETVAYLQSLGLTYLDRQVVITQGLGLVGVPDSRSLTQSISEAKFKELLVRLPKEVLPVLVVHKPGIAPMADAAGIKLQLSGHTHGGQLPGVATLMGRFNRNFVRGWYTQPEGMQLFVAPGSGVWLGFPYRLYPSELSILKLSRGVEGV